MHYSKSDFKMLQGTTVVLQVVDWGEDAKVKLVDWGEDLTFRKVDGNISSKIIKIKIVSWGEDVKLKQVNFNGNFNAIIK